MQIPQKEEGGRGGHKERTTAIAEGWGEHDRERNKDADINFERVRVPVEFVTRL